MKKFNLWLLTLLFSVASLAQERPLKDTIQHDRTRPSYWLFKGGYKNDTPFMGRRDVVANPYVFGKVGYYHGSGLFLSGMMSYATSAEASRLDVLSFTGGYSFYSSDWMGAVFVAQNFYSEESFNIQAEIGTSLTGYIGYTTPILDFYTDAGIYWNQENADFIVGIETSHDFYPGNGDVRITPMAYINLGTQRYYDQYFRNDRFLNSNNGKGKGMNQPMPGAKSNTYITSTDKFQLLDLELSLELHYYLDRWQFSIVPEYIIPFNPATIIVDGETQTEDIENVFVWSVSATFRLYKK